MWRLLAGLFVVPVLLVEAGVFLSGKLTAWAIVNVLVYPLIVATCIGLHEAGHAVVARVLGLHVPRIDIGIGRRVARWRWRNTRLSLHVMPVLGMTYLGADRVTGLRWRCWLTIVAGPVTTALIAIGALAVLDVPVTEVLLPYPAVLIRPAIIELIAFHTIWSLVLNLLPLHGLRLGLRNDGTQLLRIPIVDERELKELTVLPAILEAEELREGDQFDAARDLIRGAMETAPESRALRNALAIVLMDRKELHEARVLLLELVTGGTSIETLVTRNNLAWIDYLIHTDELRAEADENSALVQSQLKGAAFALGTRGAVLGWLGRHAEALEMLQQAYVCNSSHVNRALNACSLAYSFAATGRIDEAKRWLARARENHPTCPLLHRSEAAIATSSLSSSATVVSP